MEDDRPPNETEDTPFAARRRFLKNCGKYAVATPPAVTLLLSAAGPNYAVAASGRSEIKIEDSERRKSTTPR